MSESQVYWVRNLQPPPKKTVKSKWYQKSINVLNKKHGVTPQQQRAYGKRCWMTAVSRNNSVWHATELECSTEGNGFGGVQNAPSPVIPWGIGVIMEMKSAAPLASSAVRRLTSRAGARQLTANKIHGRVLIGLFWSCLRFCFFFLAGWNETGDMAWGAPWRTEGKPLFLAPITAQLLPVSFLGLTAERALWYSSRGPDSSSFWLSELLQHQTVNTLQSCVSSSERIPHQV